MAQEIKIENKPIQLSQSGKTLRGKFLWVLLALLSTFLMASALAAPALDWFVLNHEQKQCATISGGDERAQYLPAEPWQQAKPDKNGLIHTAYGSCNFNEVDVFNSVDVENCCKKLGYTYIGQIKGTETNRDYGATIGLYLLILPVLIFNNWFPIAIFLVVIYFLIKWFKKNTNKKEATGE